MYHPGGGKRRKTERGDTQKGEGNNKKGRKTKKDRYTMGIIDNMKENINGISYGRELPEMRIRHLGQE